MPEMISNGLIPKEEKKMKFWYILVSRGDMMPTSWRQFERDHPYCRLLFQYMHKVSRITLPIPLLRETTVHHLTGHSSRGRCFSSDHDVPIIACLKQRKNDAVFVFSGSDVIRLDHPEAQGLRDLGMNLGENCERVGIWESVNCGGYSSQTRTFSRDLQKKFVGIPRWARHCLLSFKFELISKRNARLPMRCPGDDIPWAISQFPWSIRCLQPSRKPWNCKRTLRKTSKRRVYSPKMALFSGKGPAERYLDRVHSSKTFCRSRKVTPSLKNISHPRLQPIRDEWFQPNQFRRIPTLQFEPDHFHRIPPFQFMISLTRIQM